MVVGIEGIMTQSEEIQIDGYICKNGLKLATSFKLDTGFTGCNIAIPADIEQTLKLNPLNVARSNTPTCSFSLHTGMMFAYIQETVYIKYHTWFITVRLL